MTIINSAASISFMNEISLSDFVAENGQKRTADMLGVTQGAVWQMLNSDRLITVVISDKGAISAFEKKPVGKQRPAA